METAEKKTIAGYEIVGVLGEGGTGVVHDALSADGTPVALKVMHPMLAGDRQIRGRFQREAAILRRLGGPHVCPILDFGEVPGDGDNSLLFIALPKISGMSLAELLAAGPIEVAFALDVMVEILTALTTAHAQGVIHRDLKPANVILEGGKNVVVVDFGMSKIVTGSGTGTTNLTTHNMVFGTPEYMSPEQARGDELDPRCDIYAAGVILYEMLTGTPPFVGSSPLTVLTAHLTSDLPPPSSRPGAAGRVTPALESVVVRALARDRELRFGTALAFVDAIRIARSDPMKPGISVKPAGTTGADVLAATHPATVISPGTSAIDANAATLFSSVPKPNAASQPPPPQVAQVAASVQVTEGSSKTWVVAWIVVGALSIAAGVWFALRG